MLFAARHAIRAGFRLPRSSLDIEGEDTMRSKLLIGTLALGAAALVSGCIAHAYGEADAPVAFSAEPTLTVSPRIIMDTLKGASTGCWSAPRI